MNTNETLFTIMTLVFLAMLNVTFFNSSGESYNTASDNQAIISGINFGESLIQDIILRSFDEKVVNNSVTDSDSLTSTVDFGPDLGEVNWTQFDDVDDFNGYTRVDSTEGMGQFQLSVAINYVSESNINNSSYSRTFLKKITINVNNEFLKNSLVLDYVVGY